MLLKRKVEVEVEIDSDDVVRFLETSKDVLGRGQILVLALEKFPDEQLVQLLDFVKNDPLNKAVVELFMRTKSELLELRKQQLA